MNLSDVKINTPCVVKSVKIQDDKLKFRLMELGLIEECEIVIYKKSISKKTLLIFFAGLCFTLKLNLAAQIEVEYA